MSRRIEIVALLLILAVAALLRLLWLDLYPPGWHHDEALMGVMASEVYRGIQRPIFFPAYSGQEPLYIYLAAGAMALLGGNQDIVPLRLTSALVGLATVLVAYLMGKELFGRRVGLLAAAFLGTSFWQVMSSRNGYRSITQPLLEGLAIYLFFQARRTRSTWRYVAAGAALAGTTYTYLGGRSFPAVLIAFGIWSVICHGWPPSEARRRLLLLAAAAVVVAVPIYAYWLTNPGTYDARLGQVFILNHDVNHGQPLLYLSDSIGKALQLFTVLGEMMWRYNLPGRPIFQWALVPVFYLGVALALWRAYRREAAHVLLVIWMAVMLLPSVLSWDVGGYTLRGMGLVPAVYMFPALGLIAIWDKLSAWGARSRVVRLALPAALVLLVASDGALSYRDYFLDWSQQFGAAYEGDAHVVAEARYLAAEAHPDREDVFAGSDYRGHPIISQLAPNVYKQLRWFDGSQSVVYSPSLQHDSRYVLSFTTLPPSLDDYFPPETQVSTQNFDRGIIPNQPGPPKYVAYKLTPTQVADQVQSWLSNASNTAVGANFGDEVEVLAARVSPRVVAGNRLPVTIIWRVLRPPSAQDYTFFTHLIDEKAVMWAQLDRNGYPTGEWRPGDVVVGRYDLTVPDDAPAGRYWVDFGLYDREGMRRVSVVGAPKDQTTAAVATIKVAAAKAPTQASFSTQMDSQVGEAFKLLGFNLQPLGSRDGRQFIDVTLLWGALAKPREDYTVFVQVLNPAGKLVGQSDAMPAANHFPTGIWDPGESVSDTHRIDLDAGLPAGNYRVIAGMYLLRTGARLPIAGGGDFVSLGEVNLPLKDP